MKLKRVLSLLMALVMTVSLLTLPVHAEDNDFASLTVAEQYAALKSVDNEADAQALFNTLTEAQQTALVAYAQTQAEQEYTVPQTVVFTEAGPFMPPVNVAPVRMKTMARAAAAPAEDDGNGLEFTKKATANGNGTYTITMEAYTTGKVTTSTKTVPVDVIFIIDQSGSMAWNMGGSDTSNDKDRRITIVKDLMQDFLNKTVAKTKDGSGNVTAHHRIAVVGFSSSGYNNTELLTGVTISNNNGAQYGEISDTMYAAALQDVSTAAGQQNVQNAIDALTANGGTQPKNGLEIAQNVFKNDPGVTGETDRQRVVIFLTDGVPDNIGNTAGGHEVAENAVKAAYPLKGTYGATVYTIGIFAGADPTHIGVTGTPMLDENKNDRANRFMNLASSNYPTANSFYLSITDIGLVQLRWLADVPERAEGDYYLSAKNKEQLTRIFTTISEQIQTANIDLGSETVIKDEISSYFTAPANASDINLYTAAAKSDGTFEDRVAAPSTVKATVEGDTVSVTGFDFNANFVSSTQKTDGTYGKKLIIEFTVTPRDGFLGGNNVPTNGEAAVYDKDGALVEAEVTPYVNVPIKDVTVTAANKNVYLLHTMTDEECKTGATATCNGVNLLDETAYTGENAWKAKFVTITTNITKPTDALTEDSTYTIAVTVAPKHTGDGAEGVKQQAVTNTATANVYVFKPELTFKDSEVYYGAIAPTDYRDNLTKTEWKHGNQLYSAVTMTGEKPALALTYTPGTGIDKGIIKTTDDIPVAVTAKINSTDVTSHVTFKHDDCVPVCEWNEATSGGDFLLHVKTCTLTIIKSGCETDKDANQSFIFDVTGGEIAQNMKVTVQGNNSAKIVGLPVGTYFVTEVTSWSWRYTPDRQEITVDVQGGRDNTVTFHNTRNATKWLSGDSYAVNYKGCSNAQGTFLGA